MEDLALFILLTRLWVSDSGPRRNWKKEAIRGSLLPDRRSPVSVFGVFQLS